MTLIAAGTGFAIRGAVLEDWETQFGFTKTELGTITGGGLVGFGIIIIAFSTIIDRVGYKPLMILAFLLHLLSAAVTLSATFVFEHHGKDATFSCLYWGAFIFSLANGLCEAVINPLTATLFPKQKTHYLNILHAGWPGGLIIGGVLGYLFCGRNAAFQHLRWEIPMLFFLPPTLIYGFIMIGKKFPVSEARAAGVDFRTMLAQFASPILIFLVLIHAMVGYVELGTDNWITNIMNYVIPGKAILLLVYTSGIMFVLRFFAGPIVEKINPVGLLFVSAVLAAIGLYSLGMGGTAAAVFVAATVYGLGKTFFWPTMLGVVGERFPKAGALGMGIVGGVGMLSAGFLGGPGIGYKQDYNASHHLQASDPAAYERYAAPKPNGFLFFPDIKGLDGAKVGALQNNQIPADSPLKQYETQDRGPVLDATLYGGRTALRWTAAVPAAMAVCYLILFIYVRSKGGYKAEVLHGQPMDGEKYTGGVEAPLEG